MRRTYAPSLIHVAAIAMLLSIFFVGEISSVFPGGGTDHTSYCALNPRNCQRKDKDGQKRQMRQVLLLAYSLFVNRV